MTSSLLERQLAQLGLLADRPPTTDEWRGLLLQVERTYIASHERLDHAVRDASRDLRTLNLGLEKQRDHSRAIVSSIGDGLFVGDERGRLAMLNPAAERILGWRQSEVVGDHIVDIIAAYRLPGDRARAQLEPLRAILASGSPSRDDDAHWLDREHKDVCVSWTLTPILQQEVARGSVLVFRDMGAYRAVVSALRESEARFRAAFDASVIGMLRVTRDGSVVRSNRALQTMLGYAPELEGPGAFERMLHEDDRAAQNQLRGELFDGARDHYKVEQRFLRRDGSVAFGSLSMSVVAREDGSREAAIGTLEDLTDRKALEIELRHAQKLESVGLLAAGIAHEINTPVQFVGDNVRFLDDAFGDLLRLQAALREHAQRCTCQPLPAGGSDEEIEYLEDQVPRAIVETLDGIDRVAGIVRALKSFAHPHRELGQSAVDINLALTNTITVARNEFKYVADLETDFASLPPVRCYEDDLNQAFLNLLINAAHAVAEAQPARGRGLIRVTTSKSAGRVTISFADSGPGIPLEIRDKIFDPFFTTKPVGKGTGQGLSIARSVVVDKHGGALRFETEVGRGTTFFIELPVAGRAA